MSHRERINDAAFEPSKLKEKILSFARDLGFPLVGVAPAIDSQGHSDLVRWIESGYAADMNYFAERLDAYKNPSSVLNGARSVIAMAFPYPADDVHQEFQQSDSARVARYAWQGSDYHDVLHKKLKSMCRMIRDQAPGYVARGVVDTAPIMEREIAQLAGLGWRGKNTLLLNKTLGSYFFLACVLTDLELPVDRPHETDHCGTCTRCLDACPTNAFPSPGVLDANRCISYLTIEHRETIEEPLRAGIGDWIFGCDICQEVCPWNRKRARSRTADVDRPLDGVSPRQFLSMTEEEFRESFRKTPFWRTRRRGMLRNAVIVLANRNDRTVLPRLVELCGDSDPMIAPSVGRSASSMSNRTRMLRSRGSIFSTPTLRLL